MKALLKSIFAAFLLVFISCNPDEDLDNNGNSGNNGNNGNNGGGNTVNPVSYPEIVNLLEGNWYGDSIITYNSDGSSVFIWDQIGTEATGYLSFGSNIIGNVDFTPINSSILPPPYESLIVNKYPASVTITNGSWTGSGTEELSVGKYLSVYAREANIRADKSYSVVKYTTPFYNFSTPTIQYGLMSLYGYSFIPYASDITFGSTASNSVWPSLIGGVNEVPFRIHTLNNTTLKIIGQYGSGYGIISFKKQ
jgi:hypothetical protein